MRRGPAASYIGPLQSMRAAAWWSDAKAQPPVLLQRRASWRTAPFDTSAVKRHPLLRPLRQVDVGGTRWRGGSVNNRVRA